MAMLESQSLTGNVNGTGGFMDAVKRRKIGKWNAKGIDKGIDCRLGKVAPMKRDFTNVWSSNPVFRGKRGRFWQPWGIIEDSKDARHGGRRESWKKKEIPE
jgi:hypothetical protein